MVFPPASAGASPSPAPPGDAALSDPVEAAKREAKKQNKRVEIPSYRSETSTVFANPDGKTLRMEMSTSPVRVKRNGGWVPVDTTLVVQDNVVKPRMAKSDLVLSRGGKTDLLTFSPHPERPAIKAEEFKVLVPRELPTPRLAADRAEFASVYGDGVDLVVTATPTGFRQQIVIRRRPAKPLTLRVPMELPEGFTFDSTSRGTALMRTTRGGRQKQIMDVSSTMMVDAVAAEGGPDAGKVGRAATSLDATTGSSTLVLTPDAGFLDDPAVTYPVTVAAATSDWWQPTVYSDTFVNNTSYPTSSDNQFLQQIQAGTSGSARARSYIRFEDIPEDSLLRGGLVQNADLVLWNHLSHDCGDSVGSGVVARQITSSWHPNTLSWSNQPSVTSRGADTEYGAYSPDCGRGGWAKKEWDLVHSVNTIVQAWADGEANYGFQLAGGSESTSTNWRRYRTTEYRVCDDGVLCEGRPHQPLLLVDFEPALEMDIAYERDGVPDGDLPDYAELLANQVPLTETLEPQPVTVEEVASRQANSKTTFTPSTDVLPTEPPTEPDPQPDGTAPEVVVTYPAGDATDVPVSAYMTATFSEKVTDTQMVVKDADGVTVTGATTANPIKDVYAFIPVAALTPDTRYTVEVSGARDAAGNVMIPHSWSFTTAAPDTSPPTVTATVPGAGATGVPVTTAVTATFSERVSDAQVTVTGPGSSSVAGTAQMDATGTLLTFTPSQPFGNAAGYTVNVSAAKDPAGNVMAPHSWSFTTAAPDTSPPTVTATVPGAGATGVPVTTAVTATFSERVSDAQVTVTGPGSSSVAGTAQMDATGTLLTFTPSQPFGNAAGYTVNVSAAKDAAGNVMAPHSWSFTTQNGGLVAAYAMNEGSGTTINDLSGKNNTGTASDTTWVTGKYGKALSFNGTSSWVTVNDSSSLRLSAGATLSAWVKPATVNDWRTVLMKEHNIYGVAYVLYASNGAVPSGWYATTSETDGAIASGTTGLPLNQWSHVAATYDGSTARLFVNGTQVAQESDTGEIIQDDGALRLGGNSVWGEYFSGAIDEVRIYNRALTAGQIQDDMNTAVTSTSLARTGATAPQVRVQTVQAGRTGPPEKWPENRIKFSDCWQQKEANDRRNHPHGWVRDSYNWCSVRTVGKARVQKINQETPCDCVMDWKVKGKLEFLFSVAAHTYAGGKRDSQYAGIDQNNGGINGRTIDVWTRIDDIKVSGRGSVYWPESTLLAVEMPAAPSNACGQGQGGRNITLAQWRDESNKQVHFQYVADVSRGTGPHRITTCTLTPQLIVPPHPMQRGRYINTKMADEPVRCDTSEEIKDLYGGCVFGVMVPTFEVPMIWGSENGQPIMNESADLIRRALQNPNDEDLFPRKGEPKIIPGTPQTGPLHRSFSKAIEDGNRDQSKKYCAEMLVALGNLPKPLDKDCDEFPFASSHEGSKEDGRRNVAVDYIIWNHNIGAGGKLRWFFQYYRVLGSDPEGKYKWHPFESFYVKIPDW